MNVADYEYLSNFLLGTSGLSLGANKEYLLEARLCPLAQTWGLSGLSELVQTLKSGKIPQLRSAVTEAMTTNETSFFRDKTPFEELKTRLLPEMIEARKITQRLRIWCAAGSTGQEPYTISMVIQEHFPMLATWNVEILATDIAQSAMDRATTGIYSQFEVQRGLPVQFLMKYFDQCPTGWKVKDQVKKLVKWQQLNLLDDFKSLGLFDILFCRNVLIYFENATKKNILDRMTAMLRPDGYLLLGAAETVLGICNGFAKCRESKAAVYTLAGRESGAKAV